MNSLLLRDLRNLIQRDNRLVLGIVLALTLPMSMYHSSKTGLTRRSQNTLTDNLDLQNTRLIEERYKDSAFLSIKDLFTLWEIKRSSQYSDLTFNPLSLLDHPSLLCLTEVIKDNSKNQQYIPQDCNNSNMFSELLRLDSYGELKGVCIPYIYSKIKHESINQLTRLILVFNRLNLIPNRVSIDDYTRGSPRAVRFRMNLLNTICFKNLTIRSNKYIDSKKILSNYSKIVKNKHILKEITRRSNSSIFWAQFKQRYITYSIYSLVELYEQERIISFCLIYILFLYDYFFTVAIRYILQLRYLSVSWAEGNQYTNILKLVTQQDLLDWKELLNRFIIIQINDINEYTTVELTMDRFFNRIKDSSLFSFKRVPFRLRSYSDRSIYDISKIRNNLMDHFGICISDINITSDYSVKLANHLFICQIILPKIISKDVLMDRIDSSFSKLNNKSLVLPDFFVELLNIDENGYSFKKVLQRKDSHLIESEMLQDWDPPFLDYSDSEIQSKKGNKSHFSGNSQIYYIPRIRKNYFRGNWRKNYSNILDSFWISFQNDGVVRFFLPRNLDESEVLSDIQFQVSSLLVRLYKIIEKNQNHCITIRSFFEERYETLARSQSRLYLQNRKGSFGLEKSMNEILNSRNNLIEDQTSQNSFDFYILSLFESRGPEFFYWLKRLSLHKNIASMFLTRTKSLYKDAIFGDINTYIRDEARHTRYIVNFNRLSKYLISYRVRWIFWRDDICQKWGLFRKYIPWFFTSNWWRYFYDLIVETYPEIMLNLSDQSKLNFPNKVSVNTRNTLVYLLADFRLIFKRDSIKKILARLDFIILKELTNPSQRKTTCSRWSILRCLNKPILPYSLFLIVVVLLFFKHFLSPVLGLNPFYLWNQFHTIRYLIDPMRSFYLKKVMYSPSTKQMQTRYLLIHSFKRFLNYINNLLFYLFVRSKLDLWILQKGSPDTLRVKRQLLTQYFVTNKTICKYVDGSQISDSNFLVDNIVDSSFLLEGFHLLSYLSRFCQKDLLSYKIRKSDLAEKWVLSALGKNILFSAIMRREGVPNIPYRDMPILFQSGLLPIQGIPLVGPIETGRALIIRNITSNSSFPLIRIPLKKLLYNRSFLINIRGRFISRQSVHRLNLIFAIAKELSPCIIWIQDIHELNIDRFYHRLEANPRFLLCIILKKISNDHRKSCSINNLVIALTHLPRKLDPALIAPNRLNQLINFRRSTGRQRRQELSMLFRIKGFETEISPLLLQGIDSITMGYSKQDFSYFANGTLLITNSRKRERILWSDAIELALLRQNSIVNTIGNKHQSSSEIEKLSYKIAKSFLKNSFLKVPFTNLSFVNTNLFKKRFYYLYNWHLEPSRNESTINELTILPYILFLLVGLAARDCWFNLHVRKKENRFGINKAEENDFNLACGILEILSKDFFCSEINRSTSQKNSFPFVSLIDRSYSSSIIYQGYSSKPGKGYLSNIHNSKQLVRMDSILTGIIREIAWSPKMWHLSFTRSCSFESIRLLSESNNLANMFLFYQDQGQIPQRDFDLNKIKYKKEKLYKGKKYSFGYRRSLGNLRKREIKKLENQLDNILLRERFAGLGISEICNQYKTQLNQSLEPIVFLGKQFVWDPVLPIYLDYNIVSSYRNLLVKQELVRRLYITYGIRREREKHFSNEKIKSFFLYRGYDRRSITQLSTNRWDNYPLDEEQSFEYISKVQSMYINLQYPQLFVPIHLYQSILIEDFQDRFIESSILIYRERWLKFNHSSCRYFITYNMLLESYQYLIHLCGSDRMSFCCVTDQLDSRDYCL
uniref:Ycf2 n=1 Tax=Trichomanes striatum TaxID=29625 RepID=UPI001EE043F0|nr:Ycf2 [Vandenboschia striata]UIO59646.1 Ycf2 [Vandenboschia striata]